MYFVNRARLTIEEVLLDSHLVTILTAVHVTCRVQILQANLLARRVLLCRGPSVPHALCLVFVVLVFGTARDTMRKVGEMYITEGKEK